MPVRLELVSRAASLSAAGTPFVWATVVRAHRPTSAKAGDSAIVLADGELSGFVGGECAESTVRAQSLEVLASGETRLLRITPDLTGEESDGPNDDGLVTVHNPCLSGGTLEILLEPAVPLPVVAVFGRAPIATALLRADRLFGLRVRAVTSPEEALPAGTTAVVVASHGSDEEPILSAALQAGIPYVGLVASRKRGPAVLASLVVDEALRTSVHTPAGLDIGARTAPEVALSILAEIVSTQRERETNRAEHRGADVAVSTSHGASAQAQAQVLAPALTCDPVCGMTVLAVESSLHVDTPAGRVFFCGTGCRTAYLDNPAAYPP
jgi:xanthine dehydrogenase accessory factor